MNVDVHTTTVPAHIMASTAAAVLCCCRFTEEIGELLQSLDAWVQSEDQATHAHALKVQQCFGLQVEARYAAIV